MFSLYKLRIFMVAVQEGSFSGAAGRLYLTQPAVSQHIGDLEAALGTRLFHRSKQGVTLTPAGEILHSYGKDILQLVAEVEDRIIEVENLSGGSISISATPGVSVYYLPAWMQDFQCRFPKLTLSLNTLLTKDVVDSVAKHRVDLGFLEGELAELDRPELGSITLKEIEFFVMTNADHPWAQRDIIQLAELSTQPFLARLSSSRTRRWLEDILAREQVSLRINVELDTPGAIKYGLMSGSGITILPEYAVERERKRDEIHLLRIDNFPLKRPLKLIWDKADSLRPITRAFITDLSDQFPQLSAIL